MSDALAECLRIATRLGSRFPEDLSVRWAGELLRDPPEDATTAIAALERAARDMVLGPWLAWADAQGREVHMANTRAREAVGLCKENDPRPCGEDLAAIERACGVSNAENTQFRDRRQVMNQRLAHKRHQQNRSSNPYHIRNKTWKDEHCLRARRCFLTPQTNAGQQGSYDANRTQGRGTLMDEFGRGINSMDDPRGCCPGMTGRHLVYQSWTSPRGGNNPCRSFRGGQAPTVCVVGTNQNDAEHAWM